MTRPCPQCRVGALALITDGLVGDPYAPPTHYVNGVRQDHLTIRWRLAAFYACNTCEFCVEYEKS